MSIHQEIFMNIKFFFHGILLKHSFPIYFNVKFKVQLVWIIIKVLKILIVDIVFGNTFKMIWWFRISGHSFIRYKTSLNITYLNWKKKESYFNFKKLLSMVSVLIRISWFLWSSFILVILIWIYHLFQVI